MTPRGSASALPEEQALIGPNAITQLRLALIDGLGSDAARRIFEKADAATAFDTPPTEMIDERLARRVFDTLFQTLPPDQAGDLARTAGTRTADYIIANRIPKLAVGVLRWAPPSVAGPMLIRAIAKHAWTFAGSGRFKTLPRRRSAPARVTIEGNPLSMPSAVWHRAVFERLFQVLVCRGATVKATQTQLRDGRVGPTTTAPRTSDRLDLHYGRRGVSRRCPRLNGAAAPLLCIHCVATPTPA